MVAYTAVSAVGPEGSMVKSTSSRAGGNGGGVLVAAKDIVGGAPGVFTHLCGVCGERMSGAAWGGGSSGMRAGLFRTFCGTDAQGHYLLVVGPVVYFCDHQEACKKLGLRGPVSAFVAIHKLGGRLPTVIVRVDEEDLGPGYCYLRLVWAPARSVLATVLGANPRVVDFLRAVYTAGGSVGQAWALLRGVPGMKTIVEELSAEGVVEMLHVRASGGRQLVAEDDLEVLEAFADIVRRYGDGVRVGGTFSDGPRLVAYLQGKGVSMVHHREMVDAVRRDWDLIAGGGRVDGKENVAARGRFERLAALGRQVLRLLWAHVALGWPQSSAESQELEGGNLSDAALGKLAAEQALIERVAGCSYGATYDAVAAATAFRAVVGQIFLRCGYEAAQGYAVRMGVAVVEGA